MDARPWDFQAEEFTLQANINRFHNRRYEKPNTNSQPPSIMNNSQGNSPGYFIDVDIFQSVDNNFLSVLSRDVELTNEFKYNYEAWLEREVFKFTIDWDQLLVQNNI